MRGEKKNKLDIDSFKSQFPYLFPNYRYEAREYFDFCKRASMSFSVDSVRAYQLSIPRHLKFGTYNKRLAAAKKIVEEWVSKTNPDEYPATAFLLKSIRGKKKADSTVNQDRWHTPEVINRMIESSGKKSAVIILFLTCSGVRAGEAVGIRREDITKDGDFYLITVNGKGNKERIIPVEKYVIDRVIEVFKGKSFLFETSFEKQYDPDSFSKMVTKAGKKIGIRTSAHRMRHSFATQFLKTNPGKYKELSLHLGHSSVQITMDIYSHNKITTGELLRATNVYRGSGGR